MEVNWNVLTDPWVEVLDQRSAPDTLSPLTVLHDASRLTCISSANPLDFFAIHRFLLTLLYWKADTVGGVESLRIILEKGETPYDLLTALEAEVYQFNLYDPERPFLQEPTHPTKKGKLKPIGSFFAEYTTGTNIAHFHHGDDKEMRLCFRCLTRGLMRVIPWSQSGGQGVTPSIHGTPPVMVLVKGETIAENLAKNLVTMSVIPGDPQWSGKLSPRNTDKEIPYLTALTWNPRTLRLTTPEVGLCWGCGEVTYSIGQIYYDINRDTIRPSKPGRPKSEKSPFLWKDPAALYLKSEGDDAFKPVAIYDETGSVVRKEVEASVLRQNGNECEIDLIVPRTDGKAKSFDHLLHHQSKLDLSVLKERFNEASSKSVISQRGWNLPQSIPLVSLSSRIIQTALDYYNAADWLSFETSAYKTMKQAPAAFSRMSAVYWAVREKSNTDSGSPMPSRAAVWLTLKLLAFAPTSFRYTSTSGYNPIKSLYYAIEDQQAKSEGRNRPQTLSKYPVSFPSGRNLERELRDHLARHIVSTGEPIAWTRLCADLSCLMDKIGSNSPKLASN